MGEDTGMEPRDPNTSKALLKQAAELKSALVAYATSPGFKKRLAARFGSLSGTGLSQENAIYEAIESIIYDRGPGSEPLIDRFLRTNKSLSTADRAIYESWRDHAVFGIFKVIEHQDDRMVLRNLIDEFDYPTYASQAAENIASATVNGYVMTRIVPIGNAFTLSGTSKNFGPQDTHTAYAMAARLLSVDHSLPFRNPAKLAKASATVANQHRIFTELFGATTLIGTGAQMIDAYRKFLATCTQESVPGSEASGNTTVDGTDLAPDDSFPTGFAQREGVRLTHHPLKGAVFLIDYDVLEAAHSAPPTDAQEPGATVLRSYLEDSQIPSFVLVALAEAHPGTVDELYKVALGLPDFSWQRDGATLLRKYKPAVIDQDQMPRIAMVPTHLADAFANLG